MSGTACTPCPQGYFKSNGAQNETALDECQMCADLTKITNGTGATAAEDCTIGKSLY